MNFWSEGLGAQELIMGLDRSKLARKGDAIVLTGIVDAPAPWEYEVKVHYQDWTTILRTATSKDASTFIATSVGLLSIVKMALLIAKFIVLLALYRFMAIMGLSQSKNQDEALVEAAPKGHSVARKTP
jgi:hypothetical protein